MTDQKRRNLAARRPASQKQFLHRVDRHGGGTNAGQRGTQRLVRHTCWEMTQVASDQRIPSLPGVRAARRWCSPLLAVPALIVTVPLIGFSFQGDERRSIYWAANRIGSDPSEAVVRAFRDIGPFLDRGEFRPLGRIFENLEYAFVYEAAEAAGIAPHVINGSVRLMMIAILAMTAARVVSAVMNPAGAESPSHPVLVLFPLMIGTVLVINGPESPAIAFPFISIGSAVLILLVVLSVARDRDMHVRRLSWLETVAMALLGGGRGDDVRSCLRGRLP